VLSCRHISPFVVFDYEYSVRQSNDRRGSHVEAFANVDPQRVMGAGEEVQLRRWIEITDSLPLRGCGWRKAIQADRQLLGAGCDCRRAILLRRT
jgi:hypothetical protein